MATIAETQLGTHNPEVAKWLVAIAVMASAMMELVDTAAVNVSLPYIAGNLSASVSEAAWVLTSYLVSNAVILPLAGWLANYFGRKRLLMVAVTGFTISSALCGLAPTLPLLVFFRVLQGASGGSLQPTTRAILLETFPREQRGQAMAFWGVGIVVAPIIAPLLGGWLTTNYSWRWVFFINLPISIIGLILLELFVHDPPYIRRTTNRIDYWGLGLLVTGIATLQIMLDKGQEKDWFGSDMITMLAVLAAICLTAFVIWELRTRDPVVHFRLLRHRTFAAGVTLSTALGLVLYGTLLVVPLFMQELLGFPAVTAGFWNSPRGIATMILMPVAGYLIGRKWDMRALLFGGLLVSALGVFLFSLLDTSAGPWNFLLPQMVMGAGLSFTFVPLATISVDPISSEEMGYATSIIALMRNIGASFGISLITTLLARRRQFHQQRLVANIEPFSRIFDKLRAMMSSHMFRFGLAPSGTRQASLGWTYQLVMRQASTLSYMDAFYLLAAVFAIVSPLAWLMRKPKYDKDHGSESPAE